MNGNNKTGTSEKKSILDIKYDKVGEETDLPSNSDKKEMEELKEARTEEKNKMRTENEKAGKPETDFPPSNQEDEELEGFKEAVKE